MRTWTATATAEAHPAAVLNVLTDPDACSRWAPVPFAVEDDRRLAAGSRARVSGRLAGRRVGFDVEVHAADVNGLALSATGPVGFDVDYRIVRTTLREGFPDGTLAPTAAGSQVHASISVRPNRGLAGRLLAEATTALLNAGALDHAVARLTREAALPSNARKPMTALAYAPFDLPNTDSVAVSATALTRTYGEGGSAVHALRGVSIEVPKGQFTAVMGPSGSGKSTLMHLLAGLDTPDAGAVHIAGEDITRMSDRDLTRLRRKHIGFVFQSFNLLPTLSAEENITLPLAIAGRKPEAHVVDAPAGAHGPRRAPRPQAGAALRRPAAARRRRARPDLHARPCCSPTSPRATWTPPPAPTSSTCCAPRWTRTARRPSWSPTTPARPPRPTGSCSSPTAASSRTSPARPRRPSSAR